MLLSSLSVSVHGASYGLDTGIPSSFIGQYQRALVEIMASLPLQSGNAAIRASRIFAAKSAQTSSRFFILEVPAIDRQTKTVVSEYFWIADPTLLSDEKDPYGFDTDKAHLPLNSAKDSYDDRPFNQALDWGPIESDFEDYQGRLLFLSEGMMLVLDDQAARLLEADEMHLVDYGSDFAEMDRLMSKYRRRTGTVALEQLEYLTHSYRDRLAPRADFPGAFAIACGEVLQ